MKIEIIKPYWFIALKKINRYNNDEILFFESDSEKGISKKKSELNTDDYIILATNL